MLKAVLFDLDNTLIDRDAAFQACLLQHFPVPEVREELSQLDDSGHGPRGPLFAAWQRWSGVEMDQRLFAHELAAQLQPDPKLLQSLDELAQNFKVGVISNGGGPTQRLKLKAAGLDEIFPADRIWLSGEIGLEKPDPRIFWLACRDLEEEPGNCLYVGDLEHVDGAGARAAGLMYRRAWPC